MLKLACDEPAVCYLIYRPSSKVSPFLSEFTNLLSELVLKYDKTIITWDFNLHTDVLTDPLVAEFLSTT